MIEHKAFLVQSPNSKEITLSEMGETIKLFPPNLQDDKLIKAFAKAMDTVFEALNPLVPLNQILPKIDEINDERLLDLLAWQFHIEGYELAQSLEEKRNLIKRAIQLHRYKGTPYAIKEVLRALGLEGKVKEWFEYGGEPYRFKVELGITNREITPELRDKLIKLIEEYKNVRSHLEEIILYYLARGSTYISVGNTGEIEAEAHQIEGFEWTAKGYPQICTGSVGEAVAWAQ